MTNEIIAVARVIDRVIFVRRDRLVIAYMTDEDASYVNIIIDKDDCISGPDCLCVTSEGDIFLATKIKSKIYRGSDRGKTWQIVEDGVYFNSGYSMIIQSFDWLFAVSKDGSIYSKDNGDTWDYLRNPFEGNAAIEFAGD